MKNFSIVSAARRILSARPLFKGAFPALFAAFISVSLPVAISRAQPSNYEADGEEVLTRGPVHEAFAAVVSYNPEPGIIVRARPPELIEELPPEERPEGDDVAWIPGYWGWDDERNDYLWISGIWRVLPPGREWLAGYWREGDDGYQWISGYWADATEQETTYLPPPPATLEVGANSDAPSEDYGWMPGNWVWQEDRYAWRAGYWAEGRADWVWVPAYYAWTPRGVIFVGGFWDYPVERRGVLFAPVYYKSHGYARRGYSYSPRIAINLSLFLDNLFLRPSYSHYYFGDYYGPRYEQDGFYASVSFQSSRQGFDPFYSHNRWEHRSDRGWENHFQASYQDRRDHEAARPPRTWSAQVRINSSPAAGRQIRIELAAPFVQLARNHDNPVRFQSVPQGDRQRLGQRGREVQQTRDQRRTVEAKTAVTTGRNVGAAVEPARVTAPRSPIVARPSGQRGRDSAPPQAQQAPRPDPQAQTRAEAPGRQPNADRRNSPPETRQSETERKGPADRRGAVSDERNQQPAAEQRATVAAARAQEDSRRKEQEVQARARQDDERRTRDAGERAQAVERSQQAADQRAKGAADAKAREESQRNARQDSDRRNREAVTRSQTDERSQQQAEERRNAAEAKARQEDSHRKAQESQKQAQQEADRRNRDEQQKSQAAERSQQKANDTAGKARDEEQQRANESQARAKQQDEERSNASAAKARGQSQGRGQESQGRAQQDAARRANDAAAKTDAAAEAKPAAKAKPADDEDKDTDKDAKKDKDRSRGR